jgi:PAS domain S-box-containing protein
LATAEDITDRIRAEEALRESEGRFRRILDLDLLGMCTFRLDGAITIANREYLRIFGFDEADLQAGRINWKQMTPADANFADLVAELERAGSIRPTEKECLRRDGTRVPVVLTAALDGPGATTGTAFVYDTTERKQIEEFQQQLIGVVGHDLRSPLAAMLTTLDVLLRKPDMPEGEHRSLRRLRNTAERMRRITRDLLDYTQARVGDPMSLTVADADLHLICADAVAEAQLLSPTRMITWSGAGTPTFRCDGRRIEQALSNLLSNAVKYGLGPIHVRWRAFEHEAVIDVESGGDPIDATLLPQLFRPFRQGRRGAEPVSQSLGLGLFIVREIAQAHGGRAEIEPHANGNRARIVLPRSTAN